MNLLHALFTRNPLMSGVAIVRYMPKAFRVKQVDGNLFFTEEKRQEYRGRVESVTPYSPRQWGTMEVDQMLHHLNLACGAHWVSTISRTRATLLPGRFSSGFSLIGSRSNQSACDFQRTSKSRIRRDVSSPTKRHSC
jgi:hypothetical protein